MPSDLHGDIIEKHGEVEPLAKRFEMACSAKEEREVVEDTEEEEEEDVLSQRATEMASTFGSSDGLRLALALRQAEEPAMPSSAAELHRAGFGHLACFANEFAHTMPVRSLADVPAPALLSRTLPLPPISRRRPREIQLPDSRSSSRPSSAESVIERDPCRNRNLCSPVRRRAGRRPWHSAASPVTSPV